MKRIPPLLTALAAATILLVLLPPAGLVHHVYFDKRNLPDIEAFIRFELPRTGFVYYAGGSILISVAREYRRVVTYDEVPVVLRHAILAAEDKNFFVHSGVDYRVLPRVVQKVMARSVASKRDGEEGLRLRLPQGGSTLTQQLARGYFLQERTSQEGGQERFDSGWVPWMISAVLGVPATNKLLRKLEEVRLAIWLEREMERRYGSRQLAKREIFARYASFIYLDNGIESAEATSESRICSRGACRSTPRWTSGFRSSPTRPWRTGWVSTRSAIRRPRG